MLKYLIIAVLLLAGSCSKSQDDVVIYEDLSLRTKVLRSDLSAYLRLRNIKDTVGETKVYLSIISSAKFIHQHNLPFGHPERRITYEEALTKAEENFRRRHQVDKVLVVKHQRKMYLLKNNQTVKEFPIALGPQPSGQKEYEGDGRTPEGTYILDWQRWETPVFHSFHISYPNKADSLRAKAKGLKPGSNIMVHGTSKGLKKKKDWTNGCIGLTNVNMVTFRKMVFQDTPIEIRK